MPPKMGEALIALSMCARLATASPACMASSCMKAPESDDQANGVTSMIFLQLAGIPHSVDEPAISSSTEHWSGGGAKGWLGRFPKLEVAVNGATHAKRCVTIWKALGEHHWMKFVDGRAHAGGPHAFDHAKSSLPGRTSGDKTFEKQDHMYDEFSREEAWESRWTADRLAALNAFYRDKDCLQPLCADMFDSLHSKSNLNDTEKKSRLSYILAEYYNAVDAIQAPMSDSGGGTHIRHALPYIAVLYHKLALLHPFGDGNSRTRTMVLQTELVRQGGHPAVLWDNYWGIYKACPGAKLDTYGPLSTACEQLQVFVLDGWCGWETTYNTNASPFSPFVEVNGTLLSTPHSAYNAGTGVCEDGPERSFWQVPFDMNHPD